MVLNSILGNKSMRSIFLLFYFTILFSDAYACRCAEKPKTFIDSISEFTAELEVVQIDTLNTGNAHRYLPFIVCKLKVIKSFNSTEKLEFVWMHNSSGTDCTRGLNASFLGQRFVVTGNVLHGMYFQKWTGDSNSRAVLDASTCKKSILTIEKGLIYGEISENKSDETLKTYNKLKLENDSLADKYWKDLYSIKFHPERCQKMPVHEFYKIMTSQKKQ